MRYPIDGVGRALLGDTHGIIRAPPQMHTAYNASRLSSSHAPRT
jgi:hypothetical protein